MQILIKVFSISFVMCLKYLFYRMERALQLQNPDLALPYWDSTLDRNIPDPRESVMFSEHLFGNKFGLVSNLI